MRKVIFRSKKNSISLIIITIAAAIVILFFHELNQYKNRHEIYKTASRLKPQMTTRQVKEILSQPGASHLPVVETKDFIMTRVYIGFGSFCILKVKFANDILVSAIIRGEDSPDQRISDAPPDL